jgi:hypothetical protein
MFYPNKILSFPSFKPQFFLKQIPHELPHPLPPASLSFRFSNYLAKIIFVFCYQDFASICRFNSQVESFECRLGCLSHLNHYRDIKYSVGNFSLPKLSITTSWIEEFYLWIVMGGLIKKTRMTEALQKILF